LSGAAKHS